MGKQNKVASRTIFALKNIVFNFAYQVINTVVNIILPPLIIGTFGSVINGLIQTIKQIINYIQLVGAGISESTVVSLYKPLNDGDNEKISSIYKAVGKTFNRAGALFSLASVIIAVVYPFFVEENISYWFIAAIVIILSIAGLSEFLLIGKYRTLLIADQKLYVVNIAQIVGAVLSTALTIVMIKCGFGIVIVQLAASMAYVFRIVVLAFYINRNYKHLNKQAKPDYTAVAKRKAATVHQLAGLVIFGSQTLIVAKFCGLAEASVYSVYNLIFTGINTVLSTVSSAMLAGMGNLLSTDQKEKVLKVYDIYELGYQIMTFTIYITALVMITPFIKLYTFGVTDAEYVRTELIMLFTAMGLLNCLRTPGATMINAKGHYDETKNRALIEMTICLVGQLVFVWKFGIVGVLVGTILAYLYRTLDVIIYSNRKILNRSVMKTFWRDIRYLLLLALAGGTITFVNISADNYFEWILYSAATVVVVVISVAVVSLIFDRKTLRDGLDYVKEIVGNKRSA